MPLRAVLVAVVVLLVAGLALVQLASDALFASAGTSGSLPSRLHSTWGVRVYSAIERIAPAPFVEAMLARTAFNAGDLAGAQRHALLMPASPVRDEMLARVAQARGERQLALEYFLVAPDADVVEQDVRNIARTDPAAAYDLEERFKNRLETLTTHPDAVAEAYWTLGQLATLQAGRTPRARAVLLDEGLRNYRKAVNLAPLSEKYLLAAGSEAFLMHDWATAKKFYRRDIDVNPTSPDAYAGLARVARAQQ